MAFNQALDSQTLKHVEYLGPVHVVVRDDVQDGSRVRLLYWSIRRPHTEFAFKC